MRDVKVGQRYGYAGLGKWLQGPECKQLVRSKTNEALMVWQALVAKRTGALARTGKARVAMSSGRWAGTVEVGEGVSYGASHEFGHDQRGVRRDGFDELRETLKYLGD